MPQDEEELNNTSGFCELTENKQWYDTVVWFLFMFAYLSAFIQTNINAK